MKGTDEIVGKARERSAIDGGEEEGLGDKMGFER